MGRLPTIPPERTPTVLAILGLGDTSQGPLQRLDSRPAGVVLRTEDAVQPLRGQSRWTTV